LADEALRLTTIGKSAVGAELLRSVRHADRHEYDLAARARIAVDVERPDACRGRQSGEAMRTWQSITAIRVEAAGELQITTGAEVVEGNLGGVGAGAVFRELRISGVRAAA